MEGSSGMYYNYQQVTINPEKLARRLRRAVSKEKYPAPCRRAIDSSGYRDPICRYSHRSVQGPGQTSLTTAAGSRRYQNSGRAIRVHVHPAPKSNAAMRDPESQLCSGFGSGSFNDDVGGYSLLQQRWGQRSDLVWLNLTAVGLRLAILWRMVSQQSADLEVKAEEEGEEEPAWLKSKQPAGCVATQRHAARRRPELWCTWGIDRW
ncbi:hypothetical protein BZA05DRAFT_415762 [Tricharina praecox]|uniref:uncharacterized protein n=1 Tax=Tricharina praecox TaxID=43433 RepID=UPI00221FBE65|nr:uncharacterized protein BZA05DRAFT_415762 [Tricharina praecox]KAI5857059.1 hypothetical protein BZA05DRAFT_415762 [Tricharina praecox]